MDYETFREDDRTLRAVEMDFIVIGESANHIPAEFEKTNLDIPYLAQYFDEDAQKKVSE